MKKILILLFAIGTAGVASAQSTPHHNSRFGSKDDIVTTDREGDRYGTGREEQAMIRRVNADFDRRVSEINSNHQLKKRSKAKLIRQLDKERAEQIRNIQDRFGKIDRNLDSRPYKNHRPYRS